MKKLLTNKFAEQILLVLIRLVNAQTWFFKFVPSNTDYPVNTMRKVKRSGVYYELDISDYQEWLIYFYCKSDSSDHVLDYLGKSEIIFDIGANIGQTAFNIYHSQTRKELNPLIYAFEPYPQTFDKFESNINLNNKITGVRAYNLGLGDQKGTLQMAKHSPSNSGATRMTADTQNSVSVSVTSLDEFVSEQKIPRIDFIKIDVEGYELQVLKGAMQSIRQFRPALVFEYSVENMLAQGGNIREALAELTELNYRISTKEGVRDLNAILQLEIQTDLICLPQ
ncbi:MAG: methyltransferase FkbM family [Fluviicola sp.]|jgi:FkbM family methyltransferase|uniref:FkbM family methyltransferase n=1 Tax=Fluviicola sp. TaxID=1917219 RepID=UPI0026026166|nr:FkbM family methyltransferase [Fluviicola sp.]MDF3027780.1 methyltransferase FkbM family [Fluviicola sp.]